MLLASLLVGHPPVDKSCVGQYRLKPSEEVVRFCRLLGKVAPVGRLALLDSGLFDLQGEGGTRHGRYEIVENKLTLRSSDGTLLRGARKAGTVELEGFAFERVPETETMGGLCGRWTVHRNGQEDRSALLDLRQDRTFRFVMAGASSEGMWSCDSGKLVLVWTKIDDKAVEGSVRKEIVCSDTTDWFQIDTYRYERATIK